MRMIASGIAIAAAGAVAIAAGQTTAQPGQMTQARVWVQNQGGGQAIPIRIEGAARDLPPLPVLVVNGDPARGAALRVQVTRPAWEYRTVGIATNVDADVTRPPRGASPKKSM